MQARFPYREEVVKADDFAGANIEDVNGMQLNLRRLIAIDAAPCQGSALTN
jgi:hypothetical protein